MTKVIPDLTPEQLAARISEESVKGIPDNVVALAEAITRAAKADELSIAVQMCKASGRVYYVLAEMTPESMTALAVIPHRLGAGDFVSNYDHWLTLFGGSAEADPDFKGVRQ